MVYFSVVEMTNFYINCQILVFFENNFLNFEIQNLTYFQDDKFVKSLLLLYITIDFYYHIYVYLKIFYLSNATSSINTYQNIVHELLEN